MRATVVRPSELGMREIDLWHQFQEGEDSFENAFLSPEFARCVEGVRPSTFVAVLEEGPDIVGFFPFERGPFRLGRPIAPGINDCQAIVHAPGAHWRQEELLAHCGLNVWEFDHLLTSPSPVELRAVERATSHLVDLTSGYERYLETQKESHKARITTILRHARKLAREHPNLHFDLASSDQRALRTLIAWKSAQYRRTGRSDRFSRDWIAHLVDALLDMNDVWCTGLLSVLYDDDRIVAAHLGLRAGRTLSWWFPAYDLAYSEYSPGLALFLRIAETGVISRIDLGKGDEPYKEVLANDAVELAEGAIARPGVVAVAQRMYAVPRQRVRQLVVSRPSVRRSARQMLKAVGGARVQGDRHARAMRAYLSSLTIRKAR